MSKQPIPEFDPKKAFKEVNSVPEFDPSKSFTEKKNPIQNGQKTGSQPLKLGSKPFQTQVPTEVPSVLTEQGKVGYEQEIAKPRPKEKPILDFSAFKNAPKPRDAYYQDPTIVARQEKAKLKQLQTDYEAGKVDRNTFTQDLDLVAASGIDMLGRMASTIPSGILDNAIKAFGNQPGGLVSMGIDADVLGKIAEKQLGLPEEYNPLSPNNALAETFRKKAELNQSLARKGYSGGITDALKLGEYKDAAKLLAFGFTESLPILLGLAATRGAGMSSTGSLISMGLGTQATTYQDLKTENPEIAKNILFLNATLTGIGEAGSEVTGTNLLYSQARKLFVKGQKEQAKEIVTKGIKEYLDYAFQKSFIGSAVLGDVSGEVSNQVWKNATDKWSGVRPDVDYLDGVGDAALISAFTTSTIAMGAKSLAAIVNPKTKDKIDDTSLKISNLQKEADNPDIPDAARTVIVNEIGNLTESINEDLKKDNVQYNNLDDDQKTTVDNLSDKRDEIKSALNNAAVSDETKQVLQNQLNDIDLQIESILPTGLTTDQPLQEDLVITPETSSNYANMTEDDKGNFVFFHVGNKGYETIKPGTGASTVTSREEAAALSKVGGLGMYYTNPNQVERQSAEGAKYAVKIPKEKVYDFNTDKLNFIEEAEARHEAENPGKAFDINSQLAYVTKIAGEKGFDMVVAQWNNMTRAQTTKELTPTDIQELEGNVIKKDFNEKYESNKQKGFEPVVPVAKSEKLATLYDKINKIRNKEKRYDDLYRLYADSNKLEQDNITDLINESDLPQEIKDEYKEILESKEETRRSQQTKPKEDAVQKQTAGQVPVQSRAKTGEEVVQGEPKAKPKGVTEEGVKAEEVTPAQKVEQLRADEQAELKTVLPNAEQYLTDGKVDRAKITDAKDLKKFDEIYDKYDKLITPLLPKKDVKDVDSIEEDINSIFNENQELSKIGTKAQYNKYIDTIFPNSLDKKILYHGGPEGISEFDKNKLGENTKAASAALGFFFSDNKKVSESYIEKDYISYKGDYLKYLKEAKIDLKKLENEAYSVRIKLDNYNKILNNLLAKLKELIKKLYDSKYITTKELYDLELNKLNILYDKIKEEELNLTKLNSLEVFLENTGKKYFDNAEIKQKRKENKKLYRVVLNLKNPDVVDKKNNSRDDGKFYSGNIKDALDKKNDSVILKNVVDVGKFNLSFGGMLNENIKYDEVYKGTDYVVFNPNQIHILGGDSDINLFKEFVRKEQTPAQKVVGEKVKVENAPKGNHLNIGLNEGRTQKKMSGEGVLSKLPKDVKVISSSEIDVTKGETTLVVETSRPLTDSEMAKLLGDTKQQAIPQLSNGEGVLYDVKRGTKDGWGEFDPNLFILQDGKNLGEYSKTEGSKQKEVESNIEIAIDLLDDINENKRKAERASSKRKAELESKIAEDTKELDNIPDATALVRSINDNFDAIKKELKEKGLLKIKC